MVSCRREFHTPAKSIASNVRSRWQSTALQYGTTPRRLRSRPSRWMASRWINDRLQRLANDSASSARNGKGRAYKRKVPQSSFELINLFVSRLVRRSIPCCRRTALSIIQTLSPPRIFRGNIDHLILSIHWLLNCPFPSTTLVSLSFYDHTHLRYASLLPKKQTTCQPVR